MHFKLVEFYLLKCEMDVLDIFLQKLNHKQNKTIQVSHSAS